MLSDTQRAGNLRTLQQIQSRNLKLTSLHRARSLCTYMCVLHFREVVQIGSATTHHPQRQDLGSIRATEPPASQTACLPAGHGPSVATSLQLCTFHFHGVVAYPMEWNGLAVYRLRPPGDNYRSVVHADTSDELAVCLQVGRTRVEETRNPWPCA